MKGLALPNDHATSKPRTVERSRTPISPWVNLEAVSAIMPGGTEPVTYHAIGQADYVQVLCLHENGSVVLVRQYRPIVDCWTLEFPGGLRDGDEPASETARREVEEETGLTVLHTVSLLDCFADVGRMTNRVYGFAALVRGDFHQTEPGVEAMFVAGPELRRLANEGQLAIPGNLGLLYLAAGNPELPTICEQHGISEPPWMMI
ncbi:NUDIX hydrolase [Tardiphaga sp. 709]|uniref:NUDIX hydrolase n=1 Tax=Tardiphaga sp. 709 TaxID=3076039 RepID=UPI0028EF2494|nr:NUDIX hydrolase [Tardiphaga sp. 709]WNV09164.1 NUDIX hydrolase [Tardiphaga sp. 709]